MVYQKYRVKQAWIDAGLYRSRDEKLRTFLKHFDEAQEDCWPEMLKLLREQFPQLKERLAIPIWNTGDKLLRLNIIRAVDPDLQDETELLQKLVRRADPDEDAVELYSVVQKDHAPLLDQIIRKRGISPQLKLLVSLHRTKVAE